MSKYMNCVVGVCSEVIQQYLKEDRKKKQQELEESMYFEGTYGEFLEIWERNEPEVIECTGDSLFD